MRVKIAGFGIMGASIANALAIRGHQVVVFDPQEPGHTQGSSHGQSRIIRKAYPDQLHTAILDDAYELWKEWLPGHLHETGLLYIGDREAPEIDDQITALRRLGVSHEIKAPADCDPFKLAPREVGVFTPDAGWIHATNAWRGIAQRALDRGVIHERRAVLDRQPDPQFDCTVLAVGQYMRELWPEAQLRVTLQEVAYVRMGLVGPVWIEASQHHPYGFPSDEGSDLCKVAVHSPGQNKSNEADGLSPATQVALALDAINRRFDVTPPLASTESCHYTISPDDLFRIGWIKDGMLGVSACSGHGFKFAPWIGTTVARLLEDGQSLTGVPPEFQLRT